jgi:glycosyltransferase involved in cell wall biosynthesis
MTPRVTVLLAVYNGGAYLAEAVDSVLEQTFRDFELLLVDDASTDDAIEVLPRDPRIRVLPNERNIGQIPSLNRGLREAQGEYVARLDADDVCLPRRLERQVALLDAHPEVDLTATWTDVVDSAGRLWAPVRPRIDSFADFVSQIVTGRVHLVHPSIVFRRDVVIDLGGFDETLNASEDQDLYRRLVLARRETRVVPETLLRYRRHEQQMTIAKSEAVWESDERSYDKFLAALSADSPAATLRMLFRDDARFWRQQPVEHAQLERFLDDLVATLRLDARERTSVAAAIADSAAAALVSGWGGAAPPTAYPERARALAAFAARHGRGRARTIGSAAPALVATAYAGRGVGAARAGLRAALRSDALAAPRRIARDSRVLRRIYTRVVDARARR